MTEETTKYEPINELGDFIDPGCYFMVNDLLYEYSGVIHDKEKIYGRRVTGVDNSEQEFSFSEVQIRYKPI